MKKMTDDELFDYVRKNRDKFDVDLPDPNHEEKFMNKLGRLIKKAVISIVPYIIKVIIFTAIVWFVSYVAWDIFFNPHKDEMSLRKVSWEYRKFEIKHKFHDISTMITTNREIRISMLKEIRNMDSSYLEMKRALKINPNNKEIIEAMKIYFTERTSFIDSTKAIHKRLILKE